MTILNCPECGGTHYGSSKCPMNAENRESPIPWPKPSKRIEVSEELVARYTAASFCVAEQAMDDGIWFIPETAAEAYLQSELRRLHALIEGKSPEECAADALYPPSPTTEAGK